MEDVHTFQYSPLSGNDSIRLLTLQPGLPGAEIHGGLIHTTISQCHEDIFQHYTALSYVWGDSSIRRTIYVDKIPFEITANLFDALDNFRDEHHVFRLWADAICINQSNMPERIQQVGLMRQLYSSSQFTVIYLGKSNEQLDEVMAAARGTKFDDRLRHIVATHILSRLWFTRVWVYQELVLSAMPWVQCGWGRMKWKDLSVGLLEEVDTNSFQHSRENEDGTRGKYATAKEEDGGEIDHGLVDEPLIKIFSDMDAARSRKSGRPSLFSLLLSRRGFGVTNLRDLIYGHLAIADLPSASKTPSCPVIDYQRSVADVFTDATIHMLLEARNGRPLLHADVRDSTRRMPELPSWVPDWSLPSTEYLAPVPSVLIDPKIDAIHQLPRQYFQAKFPTPSLCLIRLSRIGTVKHLSSTISLMESPLKMHVQAIVKDLRTAVYAGKESHERLWATSKTALPRIPLHWIPQSKIIPLYREAHRLFQQWLGWDTFISLPSDDYSLIETWDYRLICFAPDYWTCPYPRSLGETLMRYGLNNESPSFVEGRKAAVVSGGMAAALGVVPPTTCVGDVIYAVFDRTEKLSFLVLHPINSPAHLYVASKGKDGEQNTALSSGEADWRWCTLIGWGWVEETILCNYDHPPKNFNIKRGMEDVVLY